MEVKVNRAFEVTAVEAHRGGPGGDRPGRAVAAARKR